MLSKIFTTTKNGKADVLSAADIVSIIQACKESNVKCLTFGGLTLHLGEVESKEMPLLPPTNEPLPSQEVIQPVDQELLAALEDQSLLVNDPAAYERKYISGNNP
jgi:hypothetical protein